MVIYKEGDKSKGVCYNCSKLVTTTFKYADYKKGQMTIPDVLQGFCDYCHKPVSLPHQSSYRIKEYREKKTRKLDFRIPMHNTDILFAIGSMYNVAPKPNLLFRIIIELYLSKYSKQDIRKFRNKILEYIKDDLTQGKSKERLTVTCSDPVYSAFQELSKMGNKTTVAKAIIVLAKHDLLDNENSKLGEEFKEIAATTI